MYRTKKDVDKHVESLLNKLSVKEFKTRACSIARLYFDVGDYANCQKYVEQYLTLKDNNAAAYKLFGQALQKMGQKEKALEQYKTSLDIDPAQTSTILDICELLMDEEVPIEIGRANYWCEKAEAIFPRHPATFRLRERIIAASNSDPEALVKLLKSELAITPKDAQLHARLLKHYLNINKIQDAFEHACNIEFGGKTFINNIDWYEVMNQLLNHNSHNTKDWLYQLLYLTVKERICVLSITETPRGSSKSLIESSEHLHAYDQSIKTVATLGAPTGFGDFHNVLLQHHQGQLAFHTATYLLKKAKKDQLNWRDAANYAGSLMLVAWQTVPWDSKANWLKNVPEKQLAAVNRWYTEGTYRCSQAGHYLCSNIQDKSQKFLDQVTQSYSGTHWRDKLYRKVFTSNGHLDKIKTSYLASNSFNPPVFRLPRKTEVEAYDSDAQREYGSSLHHFVWTLLNYKNYAHFKCTLFDMLSCSATSCAPETLSKIDIQAFVYCAALTAQQKSYKESFKNSDKPAILPANITDLLCPLTQMKWWDCAFKFSQNELGTELTDIRATLSRGIEVVRCTDNHGLDPELLCSLGRIFSEKAHMATDVDEKTVLEIRAALYYSSAIPMLEKLKSKILVKFHDKRLFDYTHKDLGTKELNGLLEECKLYVANNYLKDGDYDKVIEILSNLKSSQAYYKLSETYKKIALEENNLSKDPEMKSKFVALLTKARNFAYKALDILRDQESDKNQPLYTNTQELLEEIEIHLSKVDPDLSNVSNYGDGNSSDENISAANEHLPIRNNSHIFRNISSTPKSASKTAPKVNATNYRTAVESQILENITLDHRHFERIETEIRNLQKRDTTINDFMEQTKIWFDENRNLGNQIISIINSNIQNTTDQFKSLKISVDQVKDQIDECRNECKDVGELKKQVAELKKEVNKLKKASSEPTINDSDLYNLEDSTAAFAAQLPFTHSQVLPPFNQRIVPPFPVPPNPYQLYNQSLYNLYNQYSQFAQPSSAAGTQPIFDPTRAQVNYPGVYPTPDQMYLDVAHLAATNSAAVPTVPPVPIVPPLSTATTVPTVTKPPAVSSSTSKPSGENKESSHALPVNVVITSSDPLPTCTTTPAPILSVTIPQKHIKGTPHNYQIQMPSTNDNKAVSPPVFVFPAQNNKTTTITTGSLASWTQSSVFKTTPVPTSSISTVNSATNSLLNVSNISGSFLDNSKSVVDGVFSGTSPNTSLNKSRTLSERSNTSVDNYDPCPDFKPIIPMPAEVQVTTGEEDELVMFSARAKLFRFTDKQWKERGIGEMKLLKHKTTNKVRVLMRREQVHKICANHVITSDMEIKPMKNEAKAYFWVANDFADETVVLEKFCIRFKSADIALNFYNIFERAREDASLNKTLSPVAPKPDTKKPQDAIINSELTTPVKENNTQTNTVLSGKAVVGGFTFSSTPTFKPVTADTKPESKPQDTSANKVNVFSGLSFKSNTSSPFSNLFNTTTTTKNPSTQETQASNTSNKLNTSDTVEEFEPTAEFKPVVPLPALVEQRTGEEDESVLFEHRAKLFRFEANTKEWKERGLGNMKLLVHKANVQKVRLLMRREQIMKVCCNHAISKEMVFDKMPNQDKAVTWCAKDFSEGELVAETFCLRFKTAQLCDDFISAVKAAQGKIKDESKAAKEEQNASAKQSTQTGFGDIFKPKVGSWHCDACYTNNLENFLKCACCEQPKPLTSNGETKPTIEKPAADTTQLITTGWGDKFKPKAGSWECKDCLVRNEASLKNCSACNSPNGETKPSVAKPAANAIQPITSGWGDKFKPKSGSWECKDCLVRNEPNLENCSACNSPKDPTKAKPTPNVTSTLTSNVNLSTGGTQFRFGIPPSTEQTSSTTSEAPSIFDGTGAHKFSFGIPQNQQTTTTIFEQKPVANIFGASNNSAKDIQPVDFTVKQSNEQVKPALLPTPKTENSSAPFGFKENSSFGFVFKPKTPTKGKSPVKSEQEQCDEESDGDDHEDEEECNHSFTPVIPLPDKVEVVTGEENETELYGHLAKLYRYTSGEWKERGKGVVKILKHNDTGKLRVVMRRDQVLKICLNHALTSEITYSQKDEKTWLFVANDFSEGELSMQKFCLRFKNKEVAVEFKEAIDKALQGLTNLSQNNREGDTRKEENDDVIFVSETQATAEEKQKAKELMLPENFFTYKNKEPCQGCRGCIDSDNSKSASVTEPASYIKVSTPSTIVSTTVSEKPGSIAALLKTPFITNAASTPIKTSSPLFQSPINSVYGTPSNLEKTTDTSMFRTPLGSLGTNAKSTTPSTTQSIFGNNKTNKENSLMQKSNLFSGFGDQRNLFGTANNSSPFGGSSGGEAPATVFGKSNVLAPPKLSTLNTSSENRTETTTSETGQGLAKSLFSEVKPLPANTNFGVSSNQSIFSFSQDKTPSTEVKSIFGSDQKTENLFSSLNKGSIFGPGALSNNQTKPGDLFASAGSQNRTSIFGTNDNQFIFKEGAGNPANQPSILSSIANNGKKQVETTPFSASKPEETKANKDVEKTETPFSVDNSLSFAALSSSSGGGIGIQKKADFQWEGAGQQLFKLAQKQSGDESYDKSKNESGAGDETGGADEEYDPHYEPIVPLPDKIVVTTGEEDEEKMFGERCKLYRYDEKTREWKERGVGEMKILYHPDKKTYRLLLRREQVHKAVLNMLLYMDLELLPMKNSDRAWTWAARNFAENPAGEQETLAVRFKSVDLATAFHDKIVECARKLQAAAAKAVREELEPSASENVSVPLRLPKHLEESARADRVMSGEVLQRTSVAQAIKPSTEATPDTSSAAGSRQVHFEEVENHEEDEDYDQDYDAYYNEEEDESGMYYGCDGQAIIVQGDNTEECPNASIQVCFDPAICAPKILVADNMTGEILADMVIYTETEFMMDGDTCTWSGPDYTSNDPVDKTVTINFYDPESAQMFYDSCETSKAASYSSTDPES